MGKKENVQNRSNSLLRTATNKRLGAGRLALAAIRSGVRPPIKKVKVKSGDSRVSDLTVSIGQEQHVHPVVVREIQVADVEVDSSILGMSVLSGHSSSAASAGVGISKHGQSIGLAVKTNPQPKSKVPAKHVVERKPLVKKSMDLQNGIKFTAPSPMTLDRVQVQMGQEHSAPESKEYKVKREEEEAQKKKEEEIKKKKMEKAVEAIKEAKKEMGEGFEAELPESALRRITNPVAAAAVKRKSLVKKILSKMKSKSPKKKYNEQGTETTTSKDTRSKPITPLEARMLARKAIDASRQRTIQNLPPEQQQRLQTHHHHYYQHHQQQNLAAASKFPVTEVVAESKPDSISDLDSSLRIFPLNEIVMTPRDDKIRDDETVSTLGTPLIFEKLDRMALQHDRNGSKFGESPLYLGSFAMSGLEPESGPPRRDPSVTDDQGNTSRLRADLPGVSGGEDVSRIRHRQGSALVDQMDSTSNLSRQAEATVASDDTGAIEVVMGKCNPTRLDAHKDPETGQIVVRNMDPLDYVLAAMCGNPKLDRVLANNSLRMPKNRDAIGEKNSAETSNQEGTESLPGLTQGRTPSATAPPLVDPLASQPFDPQRPPEALSPSSKFAFAIDEAIRNVQTQMKKGEHRDMANSTSKVGQAGSLGANAARSELEKAMHLTENKSGVDLEDVPELVNSGSTSSSINRGNLRRILSPIVEGDEIASPRKSSEASYHSSSKSGNSSGPIFGESLPSSGTESSRHSSNIDLRGSDSDKGQHNVIDVTSSPRSETSRRSAKEVRLVVSSEGSDRYSIPDLEDGDGQNNENVVHLGVVSPQEQLPLEVAEQADLRVIDLTNIGSSLSTDEIFNRQTRRTQGTKDPTSAKGTNNEAQPRQQRTTRHASAFPFDDFMDIAEAKLASSNEKSFGEDPDDRYSVEDDVSPRRVIVGRHVEHDKNDTTIPVVRGIEVTSSSKEMSRDMTPKASGSNKAMFPKAEAVVTVDDRTTSDVEVYYRSPVKLIRRPGDAAKTELDTISISLESVSTVSTGQDTAEVSSGEEDIIMINGEEYRLHEAGSKDAALTALRVQKHSSSTLPNQSSQPALAASATEARDVPGDVIPILRDAHGSSSSRRSQKPTTGDMKTRSRQRKPPRMGKEPLEQVSPSSRHTDESSRRDHEPASPNSPDARTVTTPNAFAGFFSDGLFDLLSGEESEATKFQRGSSETGGGPFSQATTVPAGLGYYGGGSLSDPDALHTMSSDAHVKAQRPLTRHARHDLKMQGDQDVLDFVFEYSEHVICGNEPQKLKAGPKIMTAPEHEAEISPKDGAPPASPISAPLSDMLEDASNLDDFLSEASTMASSTAHVVKESAPPTLGLMCGAVPLFLLHSMKDTYDDGEGDERKNRSRSPRRPDSPSPRNTGRKSSRRREHVRRTDISPPHGDSTCTSQESKPSILIHTSGSTVDSPTKQTPWEKSNTYPDSDDGDVLEKAPEPPGAKAISADQVMSKKHKQPASPKPETANRRATSNTRSSQVAAKFQSQKAGELTDYLQSPSQLEQRKSTHKQTTQDGPLPSSAEMASKKIILHDRVLLDHDDAYWDTLSTIASTKDRSSEHSKPPVSLLSQPGPIPVEITMKKIPNEANNGLESTQEQHKLGRVPTTDDPPKLSEERTTAHLPVALSAAMVHETKQPKADLPTAGTKQESQDDMLVSNEKEGRGKSKSPFLQQLLQNQNPRRIFLRPVAELDGSKQIRKGSARSQIEGMPKPERNKRDDNKSNQQVSRFGSNSCEDSLRPPSHSSSFPQAGTSKNSRVASLIARFESKKGSLSDDSSPGFAVTMSETEHQGHVDRTESNGQTSLSFITKDHGATGRMDFWRPNNETRIQSEALPEQRTRELDEPPSARGKMSAANFSSSRVPVQTFLPIAKYSFSSASLTLDSQRNPDGETSDAGPMDVAMMGNGSRPRGVSWGYEELIEPEEPGNEEPGGPSPQANGKDIPYEFLPEVDSRESNQLQRTQVPHATVETVRETPLPTHFLANASRSDDGQLAEKSGIDIQDAQRGVRWGYEEAIGDRGEAKKNGGFVPTQDLIDRPTAPATGRETSDDVVELYQSNGSTPRPHLAHEGTEPCSMHSRGSPGYEPHKRSYSGRDTRRAPFPGEEAQHKNSTKPSTEESPVGAAETGARKNGQNEEAFEADHLSYSSSSTGRHQLPGAYDRNGSEEESLLCRVPERESRNEKEDFPQKQLSRIVDNNKTQSSGSRGYIPAERSYSSRGEHMQAKQLTDSNGNNTTRYALSDMEENDTTYSSGSEGWLPDPRLYSSQGRQMPEANSHKVSSGMAATKTTHSSGSDGYKPTTRSSSSRHRQQPEMHPPPLQPPAKGNKVTLGVADNMTTYSSGSEGYNPAARSYSSGDGQKLEQQPGSQQPSASSLNYASEMAAKPREMHNTSLPASTLNIASGLAKNANATTHSVGSEGYKPAGRNYSSRSRGGQIPEMNLDTPSGMAANTTTHSSGSAGYKPAARSYSSRERQMQHAHPEPSTSKSREKNSTEHAPFPVLESLSKDCGDGLDEDNRGSSGSSSGSESPYSLYEKMSGNLSGGRGGHQSLYEKAQGSHSAEKGAHQRGGSEFEHATRLTTTSHGRQDKDIYNTVGNQTLSSSKDSSIDDNVEESTKAEEGIAQKGGTNNGGINLGETPLLQQTMLRSAEIAAAASKGWVAAAAAAGALFANNTNDHNSTDRKVSNPSRHSVEKMKNQDGIESALPTTTPAKATIEKSGEKPVVLPNAIDTTPTLRQNSLNDLGLSKDGSRMNSPPTAADATPTMKPASHNGVGMAAARDKSLTLKHTDQDDAAQADGYKKNLTISEEQRLISRTLELSKAILSSVNAQSLHSMSDDDIVRSLISLETDDDLTTTTKSSRLFHRADVENSVLGRNQTNPTVPISVTFPGGVTHSQSIQALMKSDTKEQRGQAWSFGKESSSTPSVSHLSRASPSDINALFSKYDNLAHQLISQNDQLQRAARQPGAAISLEDGDNTPEIVSRLDELRMQRARALARYENFHSSSSGLDAEGRDQPDEPARSEDSHFARTPFREPQRGNAARHYTASAASSQHSWLNRSLNHLRPQSASRPRISTGRDPISVEKRRAKSAEPIRPRDHRFEDVKDVESISSGSTNKTTASKKARELRKQLDEALKASKAIRESQEKLGSELKTFKDRFYNKSVELEDEGVYFKL